MSNCVFCDIINTRERSTPFVFENEIVIAFKPKKQISKGHTILIPRIHYQDIFEIDTDVLLEVTKAMKDLAKKLKEECNSSGINILHASGINAQQSIPHFHFHLVPRYENDGLDLWLKDIV